MSMKRQTARLFVRQSELDHPENRLQSFVNGHPFNSSMQIIVPDVSGRDLMEQISARSLFFHVCRLEMVALVKERFLET